MSNQNETVLARFPDSLSEIDRERYEVIEITGAILVRRSDMSELGEEAKDEVRADALASLRLGAPHLGAILYTSERNGDSEIGFGLVLEGE